MSKLGPRFRRRMPRRSFLRMSLLAVSAFVAACKGSGITVDPPTDEPTDEDRDPPTDEPTDEDRQFVEDPGNGYGDKDVVSRKGSPALAGRSVEITGEGEFGEGGTISLTCTPRDLLDPEVNPEGEACAPVEMDQVSWSDKRIVAVIPEKAPAAHPGFVSGPPYRILIKTEEGREGFVDIFIWSELQSSGYPLVGQG